MTNEMIKAIRERVESVKYRSAWRKGVQTYALDLIDGTDLSYVLPDCKELERALLKGAENWYEYSYGGCALISDRDIASRLCSQSELKKTNFGRRYPNTRENWLDVQVRALYQACDTIKYAMINVSRANA